MGWRMNASWVLSRFFLGLILGPSCLWCTYPMATHSSAPKPYQVKGGFASLRVTSAGCAGSSVPAHVNVTGILDSFVVTYGTTTVRNQTDFSINLPSGTGTLPVSLTYYACGTSFTSNISIDYYASAPSGSSPVVSSFTTAPMHLASLTPSSRRATPALSGRSMGTP
jgi:hypothetical protein